jgi:two-component system response regulator AtoC
VEGVSLTVEDLGSANGTVVRGRRLVAGARVPLQPGDALEVGASLILVHPGDAPAQDAPVVAPCAAPPTDEAAMARLARLLDRVAPSTISVLLLGETGVGKEVVATQLHQRSPRADRPFLRLNCAALSESLLESELFGHEKGAFTGAVQTKPGLLESAQGGTVLFDEVGEMPLELQAKLLRVLEAREVMRVGALKARAIDVRVVSATNVDLAAQVERGAFRRDLYYRLNGIRLHIPSLRERLDELAELAQRFVAEAAAREGARVSRIPAVCPETLEVLRRHTWPGNLRELRNVIDRAVVLSGGEDLTPEHLPDDLCPPPQADAAGPGPGALPPADAPRSLREEVAAAERRRILDALEACGGNQTRAAQALGVSRRTLVSRLSEYGLPRPRTRGHLP